MSAIWCSWIPVSTGYSRAEKDVKPGDFHGLDEDIKSVGDFIRRWISEHDRWASPKFLLGESYGGIRAAGLAHHLQSRYGMSLNGVVLLSSLLDFSTLQPAQGNDLAYQVFLPALTGVAHFHGKIQGDRDALVKESTEFAFGDYAAALLKGNSLDPAIQAEVGGSTCEAHRHRCQALAGARSPARFHVFPQRAARGKRARCSAASTAGSPGTPPTRQRIRQDTTRPTRWLMARFPLRCWITSAVISATRRISPTKFSLRKVQPWRWDTSNEVVNLTDRLATAMRDNPHLKVLVMGGYTDLATPPEGVAYSVRHMLNLPENVRKNFTTTFYDGGHMFYLNPPDLVKCRTDIVDFINAGHSNSRSDSFSSPALSSQC